VFKIAKASNERILEVTRSYVESKKSLEQIAKDYGVAKSTVSKYIKYSEDLDKHLYNLALLRLGRFKSSKKKKSKRLTLEVFEEIGKKKITKRELTDWWIKNVEVNDLPICEIVRLAKLAGIEVIGG
jgi:predicted DNA-binding protein YlxM (UPF0122 family)